MGSRDRDTKSFQDKLKVFFNKKGAVAAPYELVVTPELERELGSDAPQHRRLRALRDLAEKALHTRIQDGGCETVWRLTRDLLDEGGEGRLAALGWWRAACEGQGERLTIMRTVLFRYLSRADAAADAAVDAAADAGAAAGAAAVAVAVAPDGDGDADARFRLLHALTDSGKNISCFEEDIGPFLVARLGDEQPAAHAVRLLQLVINVVKYNASALDDDVVHGIINRACHLVSCRPETVVVSTGLELLEAVAAYSLVPRGALRTLAVALCRAVNTDQHCAASWKLTRAIAGGDCGHALLVELAKLLRAPVAAAPALPAAAAAPAAPAVEPVDAGVLRGAVFFIHMALWGGQRLPNLRFSYLALLPSFLKAVERRLVAVTYEVVAALAALVARAPHEPMELHEPTWDAVLDVIRAALAHDEALAPRNEALHSRVHRLLTAVEALATAGAYAGSEEALLALVDAAGHARPPASSMALVSARAAALSPGGRDWAGAALALAERYLRHEPRLPVRLHTLAAIQAFIMRHREAYGEELVERVGVPVLAACAQDAEPAVRAAAARAVAELACATGSEACTDLIDLLERILNRPFEMYVGDVPIPAEAEAEAAGLRAAAAGLRELVHAKLPRAPASHCARALLVLLDHLEHHYRRPALFQHHPDVRLQIFELLFGMRVNRFNWVGFCYDEKGMPLSGAAALRVKPLCSPFLLAEPLGGRGAPPSGAAPVPPAGAAPGTCVVPMGRVARALGAMLAREAEWAVLGPLLRALPALLHVRAPALGRRAHELDNLASQLCAMLCDRALGFPECLRGAGGARVLVSEFHSAMLPALAALAPYHAALESTTQQRVVRCLLRYGMVLRRPAPYIAALTMLTLEMRETMVRMLPEVLLDLSKVSDTALIASPMLEFLSTLTRLPSVFSSFVEDQYMSVFAIVLPYTNPSRYNHYVVSLAHHVIAAWFLKCRLSYRRNFVKFIIHGLHNYIIMPFEEQLQSRGMRASAAPANEDSSNRQRSSSLGSRRAPAGGCGPGALRGASASAAFHVELTETCVDLLARYAFTPCSVKPQRTDLAEFLFTGGQAMTWLVGHKLVTITTSGCLQNSIKQGLCDRCSVLCRQHAESLASPLPGDPPAADPAQADPANPELAPPEYKRQSSGEAELSALSQRFERLLMDVDGEDGLGGSALGSGGPRGVGGGCPCWCSGWAEVHVRSPTGDVSWVLRGQNQTSWDLLNLAHDQSPLQELAALLTAPPPSADAPAAPRPRAGSASAASRRGATAAAAAAAKPKPKPDADLQKSSSDTTVATGERRAAAGPPDAASAAPAAPAPAPGPSRASTQPINIPGSPQRAPLAAHDDDLLGGIPQGKSRHPVRRSNSSPEMSSSWKLCEAAPGGPGPSEPAGPVEPTGPLAPPPSPPALLVLPAQDPAPITASLLRDAKKAAKKSDMRVSCEAIPEETPGSSPHQPAPLPPAHHPHPLMTYKSDPGSSSDAGEGPSGSGGAPKDHHALQKTASDSTVSTSRPPPAPRAPAGAAAGAAAGAGAAGAGPSRAEPDDLPPLARSKRSYTISVMSPTRRGRWAPPASVGAAGGAGAPPQPAGGGAGFSGGGATPSFVFLQLYHNMNTHPTTPPVPGEPAAAPNPLAERPLRVAGAQHERTIKNLDLVPPVETFKVGVLYVGPGQQADEVAILANQYGSVRYADMVGGLGVLVSLEEDSPAPPDMFINLEKGGRDGLYTYVWTDDVMQVLFHVATAMPTTEADPSCNEKRKYIGNDYVSIVYNDSGQDFNISTIRGQLNFCIVVVEPLVHGMNLVTVKTKDDTVATKFLPHLEPQLVSDANVAILARQLALHASLASQISQSLKMGGLPYASNALERLRLIKRVRRRAEAERLAAAARAQEPYAGTPDLARRVAIDDFNDYT